MVTGDGFGSRVIVIRSVETGEERELSPGLNQPRLRPRWSPDGSFLLVGATDAKGRQGLYRVDPQTGEAEPLGQSERGDYSQVSVLSPDGTTLFIKQRVEGPKTYYRLLRRNLETGRETELYPADPTTNFGNSLALSPDGRQLAFALFDWPARSVVLQVVPVGSGVPRELLRLREPEAIPWNHALAWSPDGKELLFVKCNSNCENQKRELWGIPAQGGEPRRLELAMEGLAGLRFHPDGKRIAFTAGSYSGEVWVLENFLPKTEAQAARLEDE
jgi:Tol biopolymer transport system component